MLYSHFWLEVACLLQSAAMVATKLLVDDKITARHKQIYFLGVIFKVSKEKHWLVKHFALLKNVCYQYLNFVLRANNLLVFLRTADWPTTNFFFWNVLLFSCNLIGQLCLGDPSNSSRTVSQPTLTPAVQDLPHSLRAPMIVPCLPSFTNNILRSHQ